MPLLEIISGEQTSDETLYRALDFAKLIRKTPIVVNDSRGFFTSPRDRHVHQRGHRDAARGRPGAVDRAGLIAGRLPAPVLQLSDELNLNLMRKIRVAAQAAAEGDGGAWESHPSTTVIDRMLDEFDRGGRLAGKGFYEYGEDGKRGRLWSGLREAFPPVSDPSSIVAQGSRGADAVRRGAGDRQVSR